MLRGLTGWCGSGQGPVAGCCEHGDEPSSSGVTEFKNEILWFLGYIIFLLKFLKSPHVNGPQLCKEEDLEKDGRSALRLFSTGTGEGSC
jgi:hypothetical protein